MTQPDSQASPLRSLLASGRLAEAFQLASQTVKSDPSNSEAWCVIGHIKLFQGLWDEAQACAERALSIDASDPEALLLYASAMGSVGRSADAIARCDEVLASNPAHDGALTAKAGFLERAGRTAETMDTLAKLQRPHPPSAAIVEVRLFLRESRFEDALAAAEAAIARDDMPPRRVYQLHMLRSRALDRLARYDEAFAAAREGNNLLRPEDASRNAYTLLADKVINAYSAEAIKRFPVNSASNAAHVFIAGFPRSGTTLVEQILDAHPGAVGVGEAKEIDVATRSLQQLTGAFVPYPDCAEFAEQPVLEKIANQYEDAMRRFGFTSAPVLVNKNLQNLLHLGFIAQLFPKARFVLTQRDPRDVAVSCYVGQFRAEAMPYLFDVGDIGRSLQSAERLTKHWQSVFPDRVHTVRYEDLVHDHEPQSRALVEFCGLPWDERCLRYYESGRTVMTLAYDQVSRPIYDSSIGRYKNYEKHLGPLAASDTRS